jgi:uncharacterized protein (DUF1800 family)
MEQDLTKLDPEWAWAPCRPDPGNPWSRRLAAHLYRRAGFGADSATLDDAVKLGLAATVQRLCNPPAPPAEFEKTIAVLAERTVAGGNSQQLAAWWLYRIQNTPDPLAEKLTLFWHGHFATSAAKVDKPQMMLDQNQLLREHAKGKFAEMVKSISRDPAMLIYLDSTSNRRIHPNENYARELMELFCLGVGHYTETDVKEVARAFTGWEVLGDHFRFDPSQHDKASKTFLAQSGNFDGKDAIRIILAQPAAPRFIAAKLIRFFVFDEPTAPDTLIEPIANHLRESDFNIASAVEKILSSNLFFSPLSFGRKIRSPVELGMGLLKTLGITTNLIKLNQSMSTLGQGLLFPPNVKGWDGGRTWINSSTLLGRANLAAQILTDDSTGFDRAGGSLAALAEHCGAAEPQKLVDWLAELLVAAPLPAAARQTLVELATGTASADDRKIRIPSVIRAMAALPEFQLA